MTETRPLLSPENLDVARRAVRERPLCAHCLGRLFARVETGFGNDERGRMVADAAGVHAAAVVDCAVCLGAFDDVPTLVDLAVDVLEGWEFETFLVGTKLDPEAERREAALYETLGRERQEALGTEVNREVGKRVEPRIGKRADVRRPDITVILDTLLFHATLEIRPVYLKGRYEKLERGIPQTVWPCRRCGGLGCVDCGGKGKRYETSVQEQVQTEAIRAARAGRALFHGMGREDVDALMMGDGRPFILELKEPRVRAVDPVALERAINEAARGRVAVHGLAFCEAEEVALLKESRATKTYRAVVDFANPVAPESLLKATSLLRTRTIEQRTPSRVRHRRSDLVRKRRVLDIVVERHEAAEAVLVITGEAGLYIKELVSGDEGRTVPSLAGLVEASAKVRDLDVIGVGEGPADGGEAEDETPGDPVPVPQQHE